MAYRLRKIFKWVSIFMLAHLDGSAADYQKTHQAETKNQDAEKHDVVMALIKVFSKTSIKSLKQLPPTELLRAHNKIVVCIDLDSTLLTYRYKFMHYPRNDVDKFTVDFLPQVRSCTNVQIQIFLNWLFDQPAFLECDFLESDSLLWLKQIDEVAICSFALTARKKSIKDQTQKNLLKLGADFGKWSHMSQGNRVPARGKFPEVEISDGIIFTGNKVKKAALMEGLAEMVANEFAVGEPFTIVHIDDNLEEIDEHFKNKVGSCSMIPWSVLPVHFTGLTEYMQNLAKDEQAYCKMFQDQILELYDAWVKYW